MEKQPFRLIVEIPSIEEFAADYRHYGPFANGEGRFLFDLVMAAESFDAARAVTLALGLPAVAGVGNACRLACDQHPELEWRGFTKQYVGALVCKLMEANGFEKTGVKRAIPCRGFTKGEVYRLKDA